MMASSTVKFLLFFATFDGDLQSFDFSSAVVNFLLSESTIADISSGLGFTTLIRCDVNLFFD